MNENMQNRMQQQKPRRSPGPATAAATEAQEPKEQWTPPEQAATLPQCNCGAARSNFVIYGHGKEGLRYLRCKKCGRRVSIRCAIQ